MFAEFEDVFVELVPAQEWFESALAPAQDGAHDRVRCRDRVVVVVVRVVVLRLVPVPVLVLVPLPVVPDLPIAPMVPLTVLVLCPPTVLSRSVWAPLLRIPLEAVLQSVRVLLMAPLSPDDLIVPMVPDSAPVRAPYYVVPVATVPVVLRMLASELVP